MGAQDTLAHQHARHAGFWARKHARHVGIYASKHQRHVKNNRGKSTWSISVDKLVDSQNILFCGISWLDI